MSSDPSSAMNGRTVIVTGASAGLGAAAARRLSELGAEVVVVGRSPEKTAAVAMSIGVEPLVADFAHLDQVRELADKLLARCPKIDVLANNAGGLFSKHTVTDDGHELTFQVNHLAPFLLTALLRERLAATPGARVINTSSVANRFGSVNLDGLDNTDGRYVAFRTYATTKLENILFTRELSRRTADQGIVASCFHPGPVASEFGRDSFATGLIYRTPLKKLFTISVDQGAAPLVHLASMDDPASVNGVYFHRMTLNGATNGQADDEQLAAGLWERSAALVGVDA
jgi:NAD(P)-dependent dehydrogenase (short-subunit alcohol dehydrogenase family)